MIENTPTTCIRRVRLKARAQDALALRLRTSRQLANVELHPLELPASAILCVRKLSDPMPGKLRLLSRDERPSPEWCQAAVGSLEQLFRTAARPALAAVPAVANAVLFLDHAELLACLAKDWMRGDTTGRWWWQTLFPGRNLAEAVGQAWSGQPQHVPAALTRLHEEDQSGTFLRALPAAAVAAICTNVARAFALEELREAVARAAGGDCLERSAVNSDQEPANRDATSAPSFLPDGEAVGPAPWSEWVRIEPGLPDEPQTLLVLAVLLVHAPGVVRSLRFLRCVRDFSQERESAGDQDLLSIRQASGRPAKIASTDFAEKSIVNGAKPAPVYSTSLAVDEIRRPSLRRSGAEAGPLPEQAQASGDSPVPAAGQSRSDPSPLVADEQPLNHPEQRAEESLRVRRGAEAAITELQPVSDPSVQCVHSTRWGGVFYLINVALGLGLYGDFTRPRHASLPLPVWDFLALLGRSLIGSQFVEDPVWDLLAALSGRKAHEPPGAWFEPPDAWPGLGENPPVEQEASEPKEPAGTPLERWVNRLAQFIERQLARSLKEPDRDALRELVFQHDAQVRVTAERVTVCFSLATHPIALRIAGLDRDPAWVPAAGRAISFEYD